MKKIYQTATASEDTMLLDNKPLYTPAGNECTLPTAALAQAVAAEWNAQGDVVKPATMPLTQLAMTAIDRVPAARAEIEAEMLRYLGTELICHYANDANAAAYQSERWQPLHDWLKKQFGVALPVTTALAALPVDTAWAARHIAVYDNWRLCALQQAVSVSGSFVIGLALVEGAIDAAAALTAAEAEADFQAQHWGRDDETVARQAGMLAELLAVQQFINFLQA
jgi:chaperone required for assembly of F1-ATPase